MNRIESNRIESNRIESNRMTAFCACAAWMFVLSSGASAATTNFTTLSTLHLNTPVTSGCATQWDGACVSGVSVFGAANTATWGKDSGSPVAAGVALRGTGTKNGFSVTTSLGSHCAGRAGIAVDLQNFTDPSNANTYVSIFLKVNIRDSNNKIVHSKEIEIKYWEGMAEASLSIPFIEFDDAASVEGQVFVKHAGDFVLVDSVDLFVAEQDSEDTGTCPVDPPDNGCDSSSCDIECQPDEVASAVCVTDPDTGETDVTCECIPAPANSVVTPYAQTLSW